MPATELALPIISTVRTDIMDESVGDALLLNRYFKNGDRDAMGELFNRHARTAYHLALATLDNAADAEEAVQAAFIRILLRGGKSEIHNVRGWIMRIVVDVCRDKAKEEIRRRKRQEAAGSNRATATQPDDEKDELVAAAVGAIHALPKKYRVPVWLHHLEGLPFKEVGYALSLPEDTVAQQASRGIEQVRQSLVAAGFTASVVDLREVLTSSALPPAPATLTASIKTLIASAATNRIAVASGITAAKGVIAAVRFVIAGAIVLGAVALMALYRGGDGGGNNETQADADAPVAAKPGPKAPAPLQTFAETLDTKIDVNYHRDYLSEVLDDLVRRAGLRVAFPKPIDKMFTFTLEEKGIAIKQVLEKLAAAGKLDLDLSGDTAVFWKKADDKLLAEFELKIQATNADARCEAAYDLGQLGDKRIYPLLTKLLSDKDLAVAIAA